MTGAANCCEYLLDARAAPDARDGLNRKPLHWALAYQNDVVIQLLERDPKALVPSPESHVFCRRTARSHAGSLGRPPSAPGGGPWDPRRSPARQALLDGRGPREDRWVGSAGSLAVRWRSWAQTSFAEGEGGAAAVEPAASGPGPPQKRPNLAPVDGLLGIPTREELHSPCEGLGGFFCVACWEHVLEGHPAD